MKKQLFFSSVFSLLLVNCEGDVSIANKIVPVPVPDYDNDGVSDDKDVCYMGADDWISGATTDKDEDGCRDKDEDHDEGTGEDADNDGINNFDENGNPLDECPIGDKNWDSSDVTKDKDLDGCQDSTEDPDAGGEDPDRDSNGLIDISNMVQLNNIRYNLAGDSYKISDADTGSNTGCPLTGCHGYELVNDIVLKYPLTSGIANWIPLGNCGEDNKCGGDESADDQPFGSEFDGNNNTIKNLAVHNDTQHTGFFAVLSGTVSDLVFKSGSVIGVYAEGELLSVSTVGAVAGLLQVGGTLDNIVSELSVTADIGDHDSVGGLVGLNEGSINNGYATGDVTSPAGFDVIGGLVGTNGGTIENSHTEGNVSGGGRDKDNVGGLVGMNDNLIQTSSVIGDVVGSNDDYDSVGGVAGVNNGTIQNSYTKGLIQGSDGNSDQVGGLVGINLGMLRNSYATGGADGGAGSNDHVGGISGWNNGTLQDNYSTGDITGGAGNSDRVGGLVGYNLAGILQHSYATGSVDGGTGYADQVGKVVGERSFPTNIAGNYYYEGSRLTVKIGDVKVTTTDTEAIGHNDADLKALTAADTETQFGASNGWNGFNWDFSGIDEYPSLKSYKEESDVQVEGDLICKQPSQTHNQCTGS